MGDPGLGVMASPSQTYVDTALATGAVASPWWLTMLQSGVELYVLIGGSILLTIRLTCAFRDWRKSGKVDK
tara:strand:- start:513 stop:725 length:213 start_codon:yes stop_codon:yes gene_type:complete